MLAATVAAPSRKRGPEGEGGNPAAAKIPRCSFMICNLIQQPTTGSTQLPPATPLPSIHSMIGSSYLWPQLQQQQQQQPQFQLHSQQLPPHSPEQDDEGSSSSSNSDEEDVSSSLCEADLPSDQDTDASDKLVATCYYSSVAQKSYGNEKRFLCPPPYVSLSGQKPSPHTVAHVSLVSEGGSTELEQSSFFDGTRRSCFRTLHVASSSRAKAFTLLFRIAAGKDSEKGALSATVSSKAISIISKPSKKNVASKNETFSLFSGSMVSLFNRVNSQTFRTKYLTTSGAEEFCASSSNWTPFTIHAVVDGTIAPDSSQTPIRYGQEIVLCHRETQFRSKVFIIKKVNKTSIAEDASGPVVDLQKIALVAKSDPNIFLGIHSTSTTESNPPVTLLPKSEATLPESMCWSLVGIEKSTAYLSEQSDAGSPNASQKCPNIHSVSISGQFVEVSGDDLSGFEIRFGKTVTRCEVGDRLLRAELPPVNEQELESSHIITLPVLLKSKPTGSRIDLGYVLVFERQGSAIVSQIKRLG